MKTLERIMRRVRPHFGPDGRLKKFRRGFDAFDTFLFVPGETADSGAHIRDGIDLKRTMFVVVIAMVPSLAFGTWNVGYQHFLATGVAASFFDCVLFGARYVVPIIVVSYVAGLGVEFIFAMIRDHPVNEGFLVTGLLIPLIMPPTIPLWMVALATIFAVVIGKEAFGGTGMNILNVALTARVFIFFAYPTHISGEAVWIAGSATQFVDGFSGATPLAVAYLDGATGLASFSSMSYDLSAFVTGVVPGSIGETSAIAIGIGALILTATGIGSWRIMASVVVGALATAWVFFAAGIGPFNAVPPHMHLVMGSMLFATVFMATDPVTAAQTEVGKVVYGLLIGVLGMIIRVLNPAYPEGWMLAILLMNVFAPTIDHFVVQAHIRRRLGRALE